MLTCSPARVKCEHLGLSLPSSLPPPLNGPTPSFLRLTGTALKTLVNGVPSLVLWPLKACVQGEYLLLVFLLNSLPKARSKDTYCLSHSDWHFISHHPIIGEASYLSTATVLWAGNHGTGLQRAFACHTWALTGHPNAELDVAFPARCLLWD